jgi:hypothetical protein
MEEEEEVRERFWLRIVKRRAMMMAYEHNLNL